MPSKLVEELLLEGLDDLLDLGWIVSEVRRVGAAKTQQDEMDEAIMAISELLDQAWAEIGDTAAEHGRVEFYPWPRTPSEAIERVRRERAELGRTLIPGEVCWLRLTPRGREVAEEIDRARKSG